MKRTILIVAMLFSALCPVARAADTGPARPQGNNGKGFYVVGAKLYDPTGVEVRLERQPTPKGEEIVIRVLDSGPGVPDEALEKIFQPFYRLDDARNRQTGGAGLGLSIADRAVRLHAGQLRASNRPEGGLEVEIRIPAASGFALPVHS